MAPGRHSSAPMRQRPGRIRPPTLPSKLPTVYRRPSACPVLRSTTTAPGASVAVDVAMRASKACLQVTRRGRRKLQKRLKTPAIFLPPFGWTPTIDQPTRPATACPVGMAPPRWRLPGTRCPVTFFDDRPAKAVVPAATNGGWKSTHVPKTAAHGRMRAKVRGNRSARSLDPDQQCDCNIRAMYEPADVSWSG